MQSQLKKIFYSLWKIVLTKFNNINENSSKSLSQLKGSSYVHLYSNFLSIYIHLGLVRLSVIIFNFKRANVMFKTYILS